MTNFIIPRRENADNLIQDDYEEKNVSTILKNNFVLDKNPLVGIKILKTLVFRNKKTEERYADAKAQLKKKLGHAPSETYGFLFVPPDRIPQIAREGGIAIGNLTKSILGQADKGVHLYRYADVCILESKMHGAQYYRELYGYKFWNPNFTREKFKVPLERNELISCLVIFKILVGKVQTVVATGTENEIDPSPLHNMHLPDQKPQPDDKYFSLKRNKSYLYTYEYDMDKMEAVKYPSNVHPYAVIYYSKLPKLDNAPLFIRKDIYNSRQLGSRSSQSSGPPQTLLNGKSPDKDAHDKSSPLTEIRSESDAMGYPHLNPQNLPASENQGHLNLPHPVVQGIQPLQANHLMGFPLNTAHPINQRKTLLSAPLNHNYSQPNNAFPTQSQQANMLRVTNTINMVNPSINTLPPPPPQEWLMQHQQQTQPTSYSNQQAPDLRPYSGILESFNSVLNNHGLSGFGFFEFFFSIVLKFLTTFPDKFNDPDEKAAVNKTIDLLIEYMSALHDQESPNNRFVNYELKEVIEELVFNLKQDYKEPGDQKSNQQIGVTIKTEFESYVGDQTSNPGAHYQNSYSGSVSTNAQNYNLQYTAGSTQGQTSFSSSHQQDTTTLIANDIREALMDTKRKLSELQKGDECNNLSYQSKLAPTSIYLPTPESRDPRIIKKRAVVSSFTDASETVATMSPLSGRDDSAVSSTCQVSPPQQSNQSPNMVEVVEDLTSYMTDQNSAMIGSDQSPVDFHGQELLRPGSLPRIMASFIGMAPGKNAIRNPNIPAAIQDPREITLPNDGKYNKTIEKLSFNAPIPQFS